MKTRLKMFKDFARFIYDYYQFIILPFLSVSIFYAMEYISNGVDFFINEKGVKWRFLSFCALMQFFVSLVVIISTIAVFESEALADYKTLKMVCVILLGTTPFNISILIWVAIKLEIYRLMKNRYKDELEEILNTQSLMTEAIKPNKPNTESTQSQTDKENEKPQSQAEAIHKDTEANTKPQTKETNKETIDTHKG